MTISLIVQELCLVVVILKHIFYICKRIVARYITINSGEKNVFFNYQTDYTNKVKDKLIISFTHLTNKRFD